jgi:hypothetical protein
MLSSSYVSARLRIDGKAAKGVLPGSATPRCPPRCVRTKPPSPCARAGAKRFDEIASPRCLLLPAGSALQAVSIPAPITTNGHNGNGVDDIRRQRVGGPVPLPRMVTRQGGSCWRPRALAARPSAYPATGSRLPITTCCNNQAVLLALTAASWLHVVMVRWSCPRVRCRRMTRNSARGDNYHHW